MIFVAFTQVNSYNKDKNLNVKYYKLYFLDILNCIQTVFLMSILIFQLLKHFFKKKYIINTKEFLLSVSFYCQQPIQNPFDIGILGKTNSL